MATGTVTPPEGFTLVDSLSPTPPEGFEIVSRPFTPEEEVFEDDFDYTELFLRIWQGGSEGIPAKDFVDDEIPMEDLEVYTLPSMSQVKKLVPIYLGTYIKWDKFEILNTIKSELGWKEDNTKTDESKFEHIDCKYIGVRDYIKFLKRKYGRNTQLASIRVRNGEITRDEALKEAEKDGKEPKNLNEFLKEMGLTKDEFLKIVAKHKKY